MIKTKELTEFLNLVFKDQSRIKDFTVNGLQVEASDSISKIATAVTLSEELIDKAIEQNVDTLVVHHGMFWPGEDQAIKGIKGNRIRKLIQNGINLYAYHLPLDIHPIIGNNVQLAKSLDVAYDFEWFGPDNIILKCTNRSNNFFLDHIVGDLRTITNREIIKCGDGTKVIKNIAICTGGAQRMFDEVINSNMDIDLFITGEITVPCEHMSNESGVAYIAAGHHATERGGPKALSSIINDAFPSVGCEYIEINEQA